MTTDRRLYDMDLGRRDHTRWLGSNRYAGSAPPLTLPTANLLAAYDARVGVTDVSGACSAWADQSGNGWHATQSTAGKRPTITTTGGFASLQFDGTADALSVDALTSASGTKTLYAVVDPNPSSGYQALFDTFVGRALFGILPSGQWGLFDVADRSSGITAAAGLQRVAFQAGTGASRVWVGGTAGTATAWGTAPAIGTNSAIGGRYVPNALFYRGHILFLAIYTAARNTAVEDYITQEWGV